MGMHRATVVYDQPNLSWYVASLSLTDLMDISLCIVSDPCVLYLAVLEITDSIIDMSP